MDIQKMAVCYFPTTIVFVDDNRSYLNSIRIQLNTQKAWYRFFDDAVSALDFLKAQKKTPFLNRAMKLSDLKSQARHLEIDIGSIHQELYNPRRFDQVSVVVVDYAMPVLRGDEFCRNLKDRGLKIILLTGEADQTGAIQMFNEGLIHRFIRKNELNFFAVLNKAIEEMQYAYFSDLSAPIVQGLTQASDEASRVLVDPDFLNFFSGFWEREKFCEYYLLRETGSLVFLNDIAHMEWLLVQNESVLRAMEFDMGLIEGEVPLEVRQSLNMRTIIPYFFSEKDKPQKPEDWEKVVYPAKKIPGESGYYYGLVKKPKTDSGIVEEKILSFDAYRDRMVVQGVR